MLLLFLLVPTLVEAPRPLRCQVHSHLPTKDRRDDLNPFQAWHHRRRRSRHVATFQKERTKDTAKN